MHHVHAGKLRLACVLALEAGLFLAAAVGISYIAGFDVVRQTLSRVNWPWFLACVGLIPVAFLGYYAAYRPVLRLQSSTLNRDRVCRLAVVAAGFSGFFDHGGGTLDREALQAAGATEREAKVRATMLSGLEHGALALTCLVAAAVLLGVGARTPDATYTVPWVAGPLVGGAIGYAAIRRWGRRRHGRFAVPLEAGQQLLALVSRPRRALSPVSGMLLFWLADAVILWCSIAAFGFRMNVGATMVAFGTAMIVTRRNGPLGGVGLMDLALPPTLWVCGAHWGPAVLGTFAYRFFTLWLPLPFALATLPRLRELISGRLS